MKPKPAFERYSGKDKDEAFGFPVAAIGKRPGEAAGSGLG